MRQQQWLVFKRAAKLQPVDEVPVALIIDSPWIPGYLRLSHHEYLFDTGIWFQSNLRIAEDFPDLIPFPGWWVEYGMAIEPSAFGARVSFSADQPPNMTATLQRLEDAWQMAPADPFRDGFMPMALYGYRKMTPRILDAGYTIPVVAARGPLCTAGFLYGIDNLMLGITEDPEGVQRLLSLITFAIIGWLKAQAEVIGPSVEGIFILDDVVGFLSRRAYTEFAAPYLEKICSAFPPEWVKVYHNDAPVKQFLDLLPDTGFDVLNFSHKLDIAEAARKVGGRMCLMGNVPPLDPGARGTAAEVTAAACEVLEKTNGKNLILSLGGGVSPGMPAENVKAMVEAARQFDPARQHYPVLGD
jgi:uroporphyrinogen decarboxylase